MTDLTAPANVERLADRHASMIASTAATLRALSAAHQEALARVDEYKAAADDAMQYALRAEAALQQSRAETAAVIERAAMIADAQKAKAIAREESADNDDGEWDGGVVFGTKMGAHLIAESICALATPDQSAALAAVKAEVRADGMREAADVDRIHAVLCGDIPNGDVMNYARAVSDAIIAAIPDAKP